MNLLSKFKTFFKLGFYNIFKVLIYRASLKLHLNKAQFPNSNFNLEQYFFKKNSNKNVKDIELTFFGYHKHSFEGIPEWNKNYFNSKYLKKLDWWKISDQDKNVGDIKLIWELSRFSWLVNFIWKYLKGKKEYLSICEEWIINWCQNNQPYKGPNWKCGQEASFRVINVLTGLIMMNKLKENNNSISSFIQIHLERIRPTVSYAIAQNNNHGVSEAAALYAGGAYLELQNIKEGNFYKNIGKKMLEDRASKLIGDKGGFSQYSMNYHRLMLETCIFAEIFRLKLNLERFSEKYYSKISKAILWLNNFVIEENGKVPNTGANDGSHLFAFDEVEYTDFRPVIQLGSTLFLEKLAFKDNDNEKINVLLEIFDIRLPKNQITRDNFFISDDIGFCSSRIKDTFLLFRYPSFKFRPSQSDLLHIDFWINGENIFRDGGSNTYSDDISFPDTNYFNGVKSHNTFEFDEKDQMPRLGRFLFGNWPKINFINHNSTEYLNSIETSFDDYRNNKHQRQILHKDYELKVIDKIEGKFNKATLRWRLKPDDWKLIKKDFNNLQLINDDKSIIIEVHSDNVIEDYNIKKGFESKHYYAFENIPVLSLNFSKPTNLTTLIRWK